LKNSLILSAPHETTFANISPVIDLISDSYNLIYLCQCNYYKEKSSICEKINDSYEIKSICLKNPFKFKSFYDPSFLHRLFIKIYVRFILIKVINHAKAYIFCPGGLLEGTIAKLFYKNKKTTIMIEGGFPLDLLISKKNKSYQNLFFKYFKNHTLNNPLKYVTWLIVSGEFSKQLRIENGYQEYKILDIGVPRNIKFFHINNEKNKLVYDITFLTGSFGFHKDYKNEFKQSEYIKKLVDYSTMNKKKLLIKIHPRDNKDYEKFKNEYVSITYENLIEKIVSSKLCLAFYSTSIYESLILNTDAYFIGEKLNNKWPERDLIIHEEDFSVLSQLLNEPLESKLGHKKDIAYEHISKDTIYSAEKIKELILNDVH
jgi:hypothetical protein|tara:strand:- start:4459 stop:5577 length:1119 start_codon:yes stop_codon:yes gene_type:complete